MSIPWWFGPVCGMAGAIVIVGLLLVANAWIDWCEKHGLSDSVCVGGMLMMAFGLGCALTYLLLVSAG